VTEPQRLRGEIGRFQYLALGFGTMIGSAWVILLGDWLGEAGPGGTVLGFVLGALVMVAVGACYAELTARLPEAGSEFIYAQRVWGRPVAFAVGWFLILYLVSVTVFEALALAWLAEVLAPSWHPATLYAAFGAPITGGTLAVGIGGALAIAGLNLRGARVAVAAHSLLTYGFFAVVACILAALLVAGSRSHLAPAFATTNGRPWWLGTASIFAFCAYALNGFQAIPQAIEERSRGTSLHAVGWVIVGSIVAAAAFYCLVTVAAASIVPWTRLVGAPLPMLAAARALPGGEAVGIVLLGATAASLFKAWNRVFMMGCRLVVAMAREGWLPGAFARLHPRSGAPALAIAVLASLNVAGIFFGKGAIGAITDMSAMVLTLTYVMCCATVLRLRARAPAAEFRAPGGPAVVWIGLVGGGMMAAAAFVTPWLAAEGVPLEWRLLPGWALAGALVAWPTLRRSTAAVQRGRSSVSQ
jgi:amino acid transporter